MPRALRPVYERIVAIDPFDAEAHTRLGRLALQRNDADAAMREFQAVARARARSIRPPRTPISPRAICRAASRAEAPSADARGARDRAELRARAGLLLQAGRGAARDGEARRAVTRLPGAAGSRRRCWRCSLAASPWLSPRADARAAPDVADARFAGLQWTFVRISTTTTTEAHAAAAGLLRRAVGHRRARRPSRTCRAASRRPPRSRSSDPIVLTLDDPQLWQLSLDLHRRAGQPAAEGQPRCRSCASSCCAAARSTFDDFHGPIEWDNLEREMKRVFPGSQDRRAADRRIRSSRCFYQLDGYPQMPGPGLVPRRAARGRRAASSPHLRAILDDNGRPMVLINWNTDMGDGWEWSNAEEYPGYIKYTAQAYRMEINEIVYSLTH